MKKILLSTTFVALSVGMASAQVSLSGSARFGALYLGSTATDDSSFNVTNRFTLNIDGNAETDGGVNFFARVRIRGGNTGIGTPAASHHDAALQPSGVSAPRVGATFGGFTVAVGNILGALESTPGLYDGSVGLTGLGWGNLPTNYAPVGTFGWDSFSSAGAGSNGIEAIYSSGAFGAAFSFSDNTVSGSRSALNLSYVFGDWTVALGTQASETVGEDMTVVTVGGSFGDFGVGLAYAALEGDADTLRVNADYTFGNGTTIIGYVADSQTAGSSTAIGLGFTQSLGGAVLVGGVVRDATSRTRADLGVRFSF